MAAPRPQAGTWPVLAAALAKAKRLAKIMSIRSNMASAELPVMEVRNMHFSFWDLGGGLAQEPWQVPDPTPRIGRTPGMKGPGQMAAGAIRSIYFVGNILCNPTCQEVSPNIWGAATA
jgi:hypothetical protein